MWALAILIFLVVNVVLAFLPILGTLIAQVLGPVYLAGFTVACRALERGEEFEIDHLLAGFKTHFRDLAIIGVVFTVGGLLILALMVSFVGFSVVPLIMEGNVRGLSDLATSPSAQIMMLGVLVGVALFLPLVAAYWFAPSLVIMHDVPPLAAMKASLFACVRNFFTYIVYGIVAIVVAILAMLPSIVPILGWLVTFVAFCMLFIMNFTSAYAAYRDIFTQDSTPASAVTATV